MASLVMHLKEKQNEANPTLVLKELCGVWNLSKEKIDFPCIENPRQQIGTVSLGP